MSPQEIRVLQEFRRLQTQSLTLAAIKALKHPAGGGEGLADWLRRHGVETVDVVGIATDHCVRATALDAVREGFVTTVLLDLTAGVAAGTTEVALRELDAAGVTLRGEPTVPTG